MTRKIMALCYKSACAKVLPYKKGHIKRKAKGMALKKPKTTAPKTSKKVIISKVTGNPIDPKRSRAARKAAKTRKINAEVKSQRRQLKLHHKVIAAGAVIIVLIIALIGIHNQIEAYATSLATGTFKGLAGKCLDNRYGAATDNNRIQLYTCNGTNAQKWTLTSEGYLKSNNGDGGYCLDVTHGSTAEYAYVQLYKCNGSNAQKWSTSNAQLVSKLTGFCATVQYAGTQDGTRIWVKACHGSDAQKWSFTGAVTPGGGISIPTPTPAPTPEPAPAPDSNSASYNFNTTLNAVKSATSLKLAVGTYNLKDFSYSTDYGFFSKLVTGINGEGINSSVIQMTPSTSTKASSVPTGKGTTNQYTVVRVDGSPTLSNFTLRGTNQNHLYNGLELYKTTNAVVSNVKITAIPGNNNYPPGETFGLNGYGSSNTTYNHVEVDGANIGASGFGLNSSSGGVWNNSYAHANKYSNGWTFWQHTNGATINGSNSSSNYGGVNFERATGTYQLNNMTFGYNTDSDISGGNDQSSNFKVIITNPVLLNGQTKLKVNWFRTEAGRPDLYGKKNIQVIVNGVDKTSTMIQWIGVGAG